MDFEFGTAARIRFGPGTVAELGAVAKALGRRALIVTGRSAQRAERVASILGEAGVSSTTVHLAGEPSVDDVQRGVALAKQEHCDLVAGVGGGSALDAAKAVAALLANEGDLLDYLEVVGRGQPLSRPGVPCLAVPTTAGTGAEVTRNAVLASPRHRFKVSLRSPWLLPRLALVDPELTCGLPPETTATTGLDALTQLIEPFVSVRANPLTDALCLEGVQRVVRSLRKAFADGEDLAARTDMSLASLLSGLALANAGLGAVHGFAAPLGGMFATPHGAICAALLPHATAVNIEALRRRQPASDALRRYARLAQVCREDPAAGPEDLVAWLKELCVDLKVAGLQAHGVPRSEFPVVVEKASQASSMKGNPLPLTPAEMESIMELSLAPGGA